MKKKTVAEATDPDVMTRIVAPTSPAPIEAADIIAHRDVTIEETHPRRAGIPNFKKLEFVNDAAAPAPGLPLTPPELILASGFTLVEGVYLVTSPTGAGKSVSVATIVAMANAKGIPSTYITHFEPRVRVHRLNSTTHEPYFSNPTQYLSDLRKTVTKSEQSKVIALDSITLPLKAHSASFPSQATFQGGMQPSDRAFLDALSTLAYEYHCVFLGVLNETLIPYVNDLYGAVEGLIKVQNVARISKNDRSPSSRRTDIEISLNLEAVNGTLIEFGYGPYNPSRIGQTNIGTKGL
jgi:hypothetical protein